MLTPNGLSVRSRILVISSRTSSSRPDDVSMIPSAPAFDTADAELRAGDVTHRRLDDRVLDAQQLRDSVQHPAHATEVARARDEVSQVG